MSQITIAQSIRCRTFDGIEHVCVREGMCKWGWATKLLVSTTTIGCIDVSITSNCQWKIRKSGPSAPWLHKIQYEYPSG